MPSKTNENFEVVRGTLKHKQEKDALNWCADHRDWITDNWNQLVEGIYVGG